MAGEKGWENFSAFAICKLEHSHPSVAAGAGILSASSFNRERGYLWRGPYSTYIHEAETSGSGAGRMAEPGEGPVGGVVVFILFPLRRRVEEPPIAPDVIRAPFSSHRVKLLQPVSRADNPSEKPNALRESTEYRMYMLRTA